MIAMSLTKIAIVLATVFGFVALSLRRADLAGNNTCKHFGDYNDADNNENCWYSEDNLLTTPELLQKYAENPENHELVTEDGFILTMQRIPRANAKGVMLLEHSLGLDSQLYMLQGNESTALLFWRAGYDVWLGNQRGTLLSSRHVNLTDSDPEYWNFSFTEVGADLSTKIKFIRRKTNGSKVIYLGHSLGSTVALAFASMKPEEARDSVEVFILASTSFSYEHISSPFKTIAGLLTSASRLLNCLKVDPGSMPRISRYAFRRFPFLHMLTLNGLQFLFGHSGVETDPALVNFDIFSILRRSSCKQHWHYLQLTNSVTQFPMFDYGPARNIEVYGTRSPPQYPIWNIATPIYTISGTRDYLTTPEDARVLYTILPESAKVYGNLEVPGFNHMDIHLAKRRKEEFVDKVLKLLDDILKKK